MLGLGSSIVQSSRSYSKIVTLYEQESFSTVGDWQVDTSTAESTNDVSDSTVTAGQTAPGSSNSDWLKISYAQDYNQSSYDVILKYNQQYIADLGGQPRDHIAFSAEVYLDGPWGTSPQGNRQAGLFWGEGLISSDTVIATGQETTLSMPTTPPINSSTDDSFKLTFLSAPFVVKAGCSMYLRNIKITAEQY